MASSHDLWDTHRKRARSAAAPLALRMAPRSLAEYVGQSHMLGEGKLLRRMIEADTLTSIILHGPPGVGKTALAEVIASATGRAFIRENAASVGVKRIREIIEQADRALVETGGRTILFLDEIHRFSKAQQDALLADVERGVITLIGATTENPLFTVNSALVSRSTLFRLDPLSQADVMTLLQRAITDKERGFGGRELRVDEDALALLAAQCDGDARRALTALEVAVLSTEQHGYEEPSPPAPLPQGEGGRNPSPPAPLPQGEGGKTSSLPAAERGIHITLAVARESMQGKALLYAPKGDEHYDAISAMIKSVRGCDPDAALYWIARMLEGGEDPGFIARRLAILASEDIGNADPRAIMVADACWSLVLRIGMPEARITLGQCAVYLALAPKSNASYVAIDAAIADVRGGRTLVVPKILRDAHSASGKILSEKEGNTASSGSAPTAHVSGSDEGEKESLSPGPSPTGRGGEYIYSHNAPANTSLGAVTGQD